MPSLAESDHVQINISSSAHQAAENLPALTSLRFFAAALIVIRHFVWRFGFEQNTIWADLVLDQGVSLFFVLSGFILFHVYKDLSGGKNTARFLVSRFARIWPAHFAAAVFAVLLLSLNPWQPVGSKLPWITCANLAMLHAWIPQASCYFSFNSPSWTISTEFFFYLCFPALIHNWRRTYVRKILLSSILLVSSIALATWLNFHDGPPVCEKACTWLLYINPIARLFEFVLGMTTCFIFHKFTQSTKVGFWKATAFELSILLMVCAELFFNPLLTKCYPESGPFWPPLYWILHSGGAPFYCLLIFIMAVQKGLFSRVLSLAPFVLLGEISYSIYLLHYSFLQYFAQGGSSLLKLPVWQYTSVYIFTVLLASYFLYNCIEKPLRRAIVGITNRMAS